MSFLKYSFPDLEIFETGKKLAFFRTTLVLAIFSPLPVAFRKKD